MEQTELSQRLSLSALLTGVTLPGEKVSVQIFRCGQIVSDTPRGIPSIGLITRGRIGVYFLAQSELETVLRCSVETEILYIPKAVLLESMAADGTLALRFAAVCSEKIQFLLKRIELLTMQSCRGRVIAFLLAHSKEGGEVIFRGSREDLARHLGVSRAALFRELAALQTMGAIESHGNLFHVMNPGQLEDLLYHPSNTK